ncbi:PcfJ domain-containing protein [Agrobacterium salinitolerans]|nr:PcfJ domain-containing protein [Agrobacterium salinitolerans]
MATSEERNLAEVIAEFRETSEARASELQKMTAEAKRKMIAVRMGMLAEGDEELARLLAMSVGRVLLRATSGGRSQHADDQTLRHISDWLAAAIAVDAPWLKNVDAHGRPKKLMKFSTIAQITAEANKAMRFANSQLKTTRVADEKVYMNLDDGYCLVRLLGPHSLDRESAAMQHCIGNGAYDTHLLSGKRMYLSLRDPSGNPHATLEIDLERQQLIQLQGKQNRAPIRRYLETLKPYLERSGLALNVPVSRLGFVIDKHGTWHSIHELPDGLEIDGNLDVSGTDLLDLPMGLVVSGDLYANGTRLRGLPDGLSVGGSIHLAQSRIQNLGNTTIVRGDLNLAGAHIMLLPVGLEVHGSLDVGDSAVQALPEGLFVAHSLDISATHIEALPESIHIGVKLEMYHSKLEVLPDCLDDDLVVYHGKGKKIGGRGGLTGCCAADMKVQQKRPSLLKRMIGLG